MFIYVDIDIDLGKIKFRTQGTDVGHNGIKSIIDHLGTEYFPNPYDDYQMHTQADIGASIDNLGFEPKVTLEEGINLANENFDSENLNS